MATDKACSAKGCTEKNTIGLTTEGKWLCRKHWIAWIKEQHKKKRQDALDRRTQKQQKAQAQVE